MIASALIFLFLYALSGNTHTDASRECPPSFKISYSFQLVAQAFLASALAKGKGFQPDGKR